MKVKLDGGSSVTALRYGESKVRLVLAHGAGADQKHAFMVSFARGLAERGIEVVTFNFPYTEKGKRSPDKADVLEQCFRDVVLHVRGERKGPLFVGGKSMGGRISSQMMARGMVPKVDVRGLVFLGYPLHPPGKPSTLRIDHFPDVKVPQLFMQGTRDAFGSPTELKKYVRQMGAPSTIHPIEEGDHSFAVPKRLGRSQADVMKEAMDTVAEWITARA